MLPAIPDDNFLLQLPQQTTQVTPPTSHNRGPHVLRLKRRLKQSRDTDDAHSHGSEVSELVANPGPETAVAQSSTLMNRCYREAYARAHECMAELDRYLRFDHTLTSLLFSFVYADPIDLLVLTHLKMKVPRRKQEWIQYRRTSVLIEQARRAQSTESCTYCRDCRLPRLLTIRSNRCSMCEGYICNDCSLACQRRDDSGSLACDHRHCRCCMNNLQSFTVDDRFCGYCG